MSGRARWGLLLGLLWGVGGCLPDAAPYRCSLEGAAGPCNSVPGALCRNGYCAEPVSAAVCSSGLRYSATAAAPGTCVAADDAGTAPADVAPDVASDTPADDLGTDLGTDLGADLGTDLGADLGTPTDISTDAAHDAGFDLGADVGSDTRDAGTETGVDVPRDTGIDAPRDSGVDVPRDTGIDVPRDTGADAGNNPPRDTGIDTGPDVPAQPQLPQPSVLRPLANRRMLGTRVEFVARSPNDASETVVQFYTTDCQQLVREVPLVVGRAQVTLSEGLHCWRVQARATDGRTSESTLRRIWVTGSSASAVAREGGFFPDFDRTGGADLLAGFGAGGAASIRLSGSTATPGVFIVSNERSRQIEMGWHVGDLNGDGFGDAVFRVNTNGTRSLHWARGSAQGLLDNLQPLVDDAPTTTDTQFARLVGPIGDMDDDGLVDLVSVNVGTPSQFVVFRSGDAYRPSQLQPFPTGESPLRAAVIGPGLRPGDRGSLFVRGRVNLLALPFDQGFGAFLTLPLASSDTVGGSVALAAGADLNRDGIPELAYYHSADQSLYAVQATSTGAFESTLRAELRLLLSTVGSALIAPGPTAAGNGDYLVLLSPQGPRVCSSAIVAGCLAATGTSTSAFGAALGPVADATQGAFAVVMAGTTSALATLTSSPVGTLTITRYSGVDGSAITWMAP